MCYIGYQCVTLSLVKCSAVGYQCYRWSIIGYQWLSVVILVIRCL